MSPQAEPSAVVDTIRDQLRNLAVSGVAMTELTALWSG